MISIEQMADELTRLSARLDAAQEELLRCVREEAAAEHEYRKARANSYLSTQGTVAEREAQTDKIVAEEKHRAHLAAGLSKSALEAVRNVRQQMSAVQTLASAAKEELRMAGVGS